MKRKIKNLLFDFGNVLIDIDLDGAYARLESLFRKDFKRDVVEKAYLDYECGRISTDLFINAMLSQSDHKVQALDIIEAWSSMLIGIPEYRLDMLDKLRLNYNVYLLSNTNALHIEWVHRHLRHVHQVEDFEKQYFDHAYYSHLVGDRKPNASFFKFVSEDSYMTPALTLFFDDMQANLDTAASLGFQTYLVKPGEEIALFLKEEGFF